MLTVILKGTNGCNLDCLYCSLGEKIKHDTISLEKLIEVLGYICHVCEVRNESDFNLILHGGEPTLVPVSLYKEAFCWLKESYPKINAHLMMQTNGFHISEEMLEFIKTFNIRVGVSIDGSKEIHDKERRSKSGKGTFEIVAENIDRLVACGVNVSCLMVLTSIGLMSGYDFINFFAEKGLHLKINPLIDYGEVYKNPELSIKSGEYAKYLIELYEYVVSNDIDVDISPLDKYVQASISKSRIKECTYNAQCNKDFLCIDYRGDIYPCGKFSDINYYKIGDVSTLSPNILENKTLCKIMERRNSNMPSQCITCKYVSKCNSGCSAEAAIEGDIWQTPKLCKDYKILFNYFERDGLVFLREHLQKKKEELLGEVKNEI